MKRILLFILPILIIVTLGFVVFGLIQVRFEKGKLLDETKTRAKTVAESIELSSNYIFLNNDLKYAQRLADSFQRRERFQGCILYDKNGKILAITKKISKWYQKDKSHLDEILDTKMPYGSLKQIQKYSIYSYILPVKNDQGKNLGFIEIIYDTSFVFPRLAELWEHISIVLIILIISIIAISIFIHRQIFILPVRQLTEWFKHFQKGNIDQLRPFNDKGEFGKLASEVEQVALNLRVARKVVSEKAQARLKKEEMWTETKLRDLVHAKLGDNAFVVVSNREPFMHVIDDLSGRAKCVRPASGVVTAIDPILRACGGTWIAHGSGNADKKFVNSKNRLGVPPEDNRYILKRVWLSKEEEEGYYYGFANEGLWPLCHVTHTRPVFRESDWLMYKEVNQKFANTVIEELPASNPFVFIQDYHFTLLPQMIKEKRPDAIIALFWHIPWPNPEVFAICPYQKEILYGMLASDILGFHVQFHCNNFLDTANRLIECRVDTEKFSVVVSGRETQIKSYPISINGSFVEKPEDAIKDPISIGKISEEFDLRGKIIALGVERIDYTKGIVERVLAVDRFLEKYPEYKEKFVFIQIGSPSRTHIKRYHDLIAEIDGLVEKKNGKHSVGKWMPIIYLKRHFPPEEIKPYYALADICIVSSLHDGMNLVAKEYVGAKADLNGTLILSRFTGAARELTDAILVNPYSVEEFADSIKYAIEMPIEEKQKRMENMRNIVRENNVYKWAGNIITDLAALKKG